MLFLPDYTETIAISVFILYNLHAAAGLHLWISADGQGAPDDNGAGAKYRFDAASQREAALLLREG